MLREISRRLQEGRSFGATRVAGTGRVNDFETTWFSNLL